jgi:hypothetical protein
MKSFTTIYVELLKNPAFHKISDSAFRIYVYLKIFSNLELSDPFPKYQTISKVSGVDTVTVEDAITELIEKGIIMVSEIGDSKCINLTFEKTIKNITSDTTELEPVPNSPLLVNSNRGTSGFDVPKNEKTSGFDVPNAVGSGKLPTNENCGHSALEESPGGRKNAPTGFVNKSLNLDLNLNFKLDLSIDSNLVNLDLNLLDLSNVFILKSSKSSNKHLDITRYIPFGNNKKKVILLLYFISIGFTDIDYLINRITILPIFYLSVVRYEVISNLDKIRNLDRYIIAFLEKEKPEQHYVYNRNNKAGAMLFLDYSDKLIKRYNTKKRVIYNTKFREEIGEDQYLQVKAHLESRDLQTEYSDKLFKFAKEYYRIGQLPDFSKIKPVDQSEFIAKFREAGLIE